MFLVWHALMRLADLIFQSEWLWCIPSPPRSSCKQLMLILVPLLTVPNRDAITL